MKPIVLATDGSETAAAATEAAIAEATAQDAPLVVVTVWDVLYSQFGFPVGPMMPSLDHVEHDQATKVSTAAADRAREAGVEVEVVTRRGFPVEEICGVAEERDALMIVLGTHGWGALRRMVFGSVSTGVLHHARRPVLVVPPSTATLHGTRTDARVEAGV